MSRTTNIGIPNKDFFANLKAQAWWLVADRFRNTFNAVKNGEQYPVDELISIDSSCPLLEKLKLELTTPHRDFDKNGRVMVESKKTSPSVMCHRRTWPTHHGVRSNRYGNGYLGSAGKQLNTWK
jgi:phage terminase large subunit